MTTWLVDEWAVDPSCDRRSYDGNGISVDAGVYAENLTIDKAVTILGVNHGIAGTGSPGN